MMYQHQWNNNTKINIPVGKAVCIGRNYAEHAMELNNPIPEEPLLFIKPESSFVFFNQPISANHAGRSVHYEAEIALLIGKTIDLNSSPERALQSVVGLGIALDLTLRNLQTQLKQKGHPWEKAKAFDGSCVLSSFSPVSAYTIWDNIGIELKLNNKTVQQGNSKMMLTPIPELLYYISHFFTLKAGDVVLTGTPKGVGKLQSGQKIQAILRGILKEETRVL